MKINTLYRRKQLKVRSWPYWQPIVKGKAIGFHRTATGGAWRARLRTPEGKQLFEALGGDLESEYEDMLERAGDWFKQALTLEDTRYTVDQCVTDYVAHLKVEKGENPSQQVKQRLEKHLTSTLGKMPVSKLSTRQLKLWRDGLVRVSDDEEDVRKSKDSANRILSQAKAAFNLAFRSCLVGTDTAWRRVPSFRDARMARTLFLTDKQVKQLLEAAEGHLERLIRAGVLTGTRYGELATARVRDLDVINGTLHLVGKTGARDCYLSDEALTFFKVLCKDRLPDAWLLVKDDGHDTRSIQHYMGHRNIQHTVRYTELAADRFNGFRKD